MPLQKVQKQRARSSPPRGPHRRGRYRRPSQDPSPEIEEYFKDMEREIEAVFLRNESLNAPLPAIGGNGPSRRERRPSMFISSKDLPMNRPRQLPHKASQGATAIAGEVLGDLLDKLAPPPPPMPKSLQQSGAATSSLRNELSSNMKRVTDVFRELDADGSGAIDVNEFHRAIRLTLPSREIPDSDIDEVFNAIDVSGDGTISLRELKRAITAPAPPGRAPPPTASASSGAQAGTIGAMPKPPSTAPERRGSVSARRASVSGEAPGARRGSIMPDNGATTERRGTVIVAQQQVKQGARGKRSSFMHNLPGQEVATSDADSMVILHPLRQKQVLRLYLEFRSQHAAGVCKVDRFDKLLRLTYPTEDKAHIEAMAQHVMQKVSQHESAEEYQLAAQQAHDKQCEDIFEALDADNNGTINLDEFMMLRDLDGLDLSELELRAIFCEVDADHNGSLDMDEFKDLLNTCPHFLQLKDSILDKARSQQKSKEEPGGGRAELWTLGLPKRHASPPKTKVGAGGILKSVNERPSLAGVGNTELNMRRVLQEREDARQKAGARSPP